MFSLEIKKRIMSPLFSIVGEFSKFNFLANITNGNVYVCACFMADNKINYLPLNFWLNFSEKHKHLKFIVTKWKKEWKDTKKKKNYRFFQTKPRFFFCVGNFILCCENKLRQKKKNILHKEAQNNGPRMLVLLPSCCGCSEWTLL